MKYKKSELESMIDGFLTYCGENTNISNKDKLKILKDKKMSLEVDFEYAYDLASNTKDKNIIEKCLARMDADTIAIKEISLCIRYLTYMLNKNKKNIFRNIKK